MRVSRKGKRPDWRFAAQARRQCSHNSRGECVCGAEVAIDRIALWDAINEYVEACGGNPSKYVGSTRRMDAVRKVENAVEDRREVTDEIGRWGVQS